jgi:diguanylate cyclase (GGDEF)-like protein
MECPPTGEADAVIDMLRQLGAASDAGVDFVYAALDHVARMYQLADAEVVVVDEALGVQLFALGRHPITRERATELMALDPGFYATPDVVPAALSSGVASLCQLALALHLARHRASHDALTGLANRRAFEAALATAAAKGSRYGWNFTVVIMDLDGFKAVNDTFGHVAGDQALRTFGQALRKALRTGDVAARVGGDEFGVILNSASPEAVDALIRRVWEEIPLNYPVLSVSVGAASAPDESVDPAELYRLADTRLYDQKVVSR